APMDSMSFSATSTTCCTPAICMTFSPCRHLSARKSMPSACTNSARCTASPRKPNFQMMSPPESLRRPPLGHSSSAGAWATAATANCSSSWGGASSRKRIGPGDYLPSPGVASGAKEKAETHVLAEPHDVVGSPGIFEEVARNAGENISLAIRKRQRRLHAQCNDRRVQSFYHEGSALILVAEPFRDGVHVTLAGLGHIHGRNGLT